MHGLLIFSNLPLSVYLLDFYTNAYKIWQNHILLFLQKHFFIKQQVMTYIQVRLIASYCKSFGLWATRSIGHLKYCTLRLYIPNSFQWIFMNLIVFWKEISTKNLLHCLAIIKTIRVTVFKKSFSLKSLFLENLYLIACLFLEYFTFL